MEKLKKYNQRLLAVLGTLAVFGLLFLLVLLASIWIQEQRRYDYYDQQESGILSEEKIEELQKERKREQVISYETPKLIDTLQQLYVIPVSHKSLEDEEAIESGLLNMYKTSSVKEKKADLRYTRSYYGSFNNLLVLDKKTGNIEKLFSERVNFNGFKTVYFDDDIFLLCEVATKDTFRDGVINLEDFKSLYIYSFRSKKFQKVGGELPLVDYKFVNDSKELMIRFGIDKNKNGKFEESLEPSILKCYDFETERLTNIIDPKLHDELQKLLEGTKD